MNILIVSQYFWPENFRINDLALGLVEKGHNLTVLTGIPNYPEGRFFPGYGLFINLRQNYHGAKVIRVPLTPRGNSKGWQLMLNYFSFAFFASFLGPLYCRGRYDVIFVFQTSPITVGIPAIVLKKLKRIPIFFWVLDLWPESLKSAGAIKSPLALNIVGNLVKLIYRQCDRILVSSRGFIRSVQNWGGGAERIRYFPNWAEELYTLESQNEKSDKCVEIPQGFCIMFAGNIGVAQDFGTILDAAEKLKAYGDINWVVLGNGRKFNWVKDQVRLRGLSAHVHLLGRYPPDVMTDFFAFADAMLVILKKDPILSITVPGKIQSYMAYGKPIIAALDGDGARIIEEAGAGLTCPAEDADALADVVLSMYKMSDMIRQEMGRRGKQYCESNFDRYKLFNVLEGWLNEIK